MRLEKYFTHLDNDKAGKNCVMCFGECGCLCAYVQMPHNAALAGGVQFIG